MDSVYRITPDAILLDIKAVPRSSKTGCAGISANRLRMQIAAAPDHGKANAALCEYLAELLGCAKRDISLISGEKSSRKTIAFPAAYRVQLDEYLKIYIRKGKEE